MALRNGHGKGAGAPRIEVLPVDELPTGVQAPPLAELTPERDEAGRFQPGARTVQSAGGAASREMTRLARRLALGETFADPRFEPYARAARAFRRAQVTRLARDVGGGTCGPAPASIIASASLQLAASRYAFEVLGDMALGSRLADASRQNLLAAHELCAREAKARAEIEGDNLTAEQRAFQRRMAERQARDASTSAGAQEGPSRGSNGQSAVHGSKGLSMPGEGEGSGP